MKWQPTQSVIDSAVAHARESALAPQARESCGVVVRSGGVETYWPCRNVSIWNDEFTAAEEDIAAARAAGEVVALVHSHYLRGPEPGPADIDACERGAIPWVIVTPSGRWCCYHPCGARSELLGRPYVYAIHDCATLMRDYYLQRHGVQIEIEASEYGWWLRGENLLLERVQAQGFFEVPLDQLHAGDLLFLQTDAPVPHHCAIWLGNGRILHHPEKALSCESFYGTHWRNRTRHAFRHPGVSA